MTLVCSRSLFQTLQIWTRSDTHVLFPYPRLGTTSLLLALLPITILQYNVVSLIFSWFALANLWLTFSIIIDLLPSQNIHIFGTNYIVSPSIQIYVSHAHARVDFLGQPCVSMDIHCFSRVAIYPCLGKSTKGRKNGLCNHIMVNFSFFFAGQR